MDEQKSNNNVIQFPGAAKRKEHEEIQKTPEPQTETEKPARARKGKKTKITGGTVLAIMLATGAVNRFAFQQTSMVSTAASSSASRSIASVESLKSQRDADWEKSMAEQLAAAQPRNVASIGIGRPASKEDKLRWGTLEEKYTIVYHPELHKIETITLQDSLTAPSYVLDRNKFLADYGALLDQDFAKARLKSVETLDNKTIESYTLFDKDQRPKGEARFELDVHKRLLSLKVEPVQI